MFSEINCSLPWIADTGATDHFIAKQCINDINSINAYARPIDIFGLNNTPIKAIGTTNIILVVDGVKLSFEAVVVDGLRTNLLSLAKPCKTNKKLIIAQGIITVESPTCRYTLAVLKDGSFYVRVTKQGALIASLPTASQWHDHRRLGHQSKRYMTGITGKSYSEDFLKITQLEQTIVEGNNMAPERNREAFVYIHNSISDDVLELVNSDDTDPLKLWKTLDTMFNVSNRHTIGENLRSLVNINLEEEESLERYIQRAKMHNCKLGKLKFEEGILCSFLTHGLTGEKFDEF